jgi:hypothetical protein
MLAVIKINVQRLFIRQYRYTHMQATECECKIISVTEQMIAARQNYMLRVRRE